MTPCGVAAGRGKNRGGAIDHADQLAATHPGLPVQFMSGNTTDMLDRHGGGVSPHMVFLGEPFTIETLARAVRDAL